MERHGLLQRGPQRREVAREHRLEMLERLDGEGAVGDPQGVDVAVLGRHECRAGEVDPDGRRHSHRAHLLGDAGYEFGAASPREIVRSRSEVVVCGGEVCARNSLITAFGRVEAGLGRLEASLQRALRPEHRRSGDCGQGDRGQEHDRACRDRPPADGPGCAHHARHDHEQRRARREDRWDKGDVRPTEPERHLGYHSANRRLCRRWHFSSRRSGMRRSRDGCVALPQDRSPATERDPERSDGGNDGRLSDRAQHRHDRRR